MTRITEVRTVFLKDQQKLFIFFLQNFADQVVYRNIQTSTSPFDAFDVTMVDLQAKKGRLSFKDALLSKYSFDDEEGDEELCFIHIMGSPKHKGTFKELVNLMYNLFLASGCIGIEHLFKLN